MPAQDLGFFPEYVAKACNAGFVDTDGTQYAVDRDTLAAMREAQKTALELSELTQERMFLNKIRSTAASARRDYQLGLMSFSVKSGNDESGNDESLDLSFDLNRSHYTNDANGERRYQEAVDTLKGVLYEQLDGNKAEERTTADRIVADLITYSQSVRSIHSILFDSNVEAWLEIHNPIGSSVLGTGYSSEARIVQSIDNGELKAVKIIARPTTELTKSKIYSEMDHLAEIDTEPSYIIKDSGTDKTTSSGTIKSHKGYIFLEYVQEIFPQLQYPGLKEKVFYKNAKTDSARVQQFANDAKSLLENLVTIHSLGIIHCDLKLENIGRNKHGQLRIFDFDLSHKLDEDSHQYISTSSFGTRYYLPPEVVHPAIPGNFVYTDKLDVYALGLLLYQMLPDYVTAPPNPKPINTAEIDYRDAHGKVTSRDDEDDEIGKEYTLKINQPFLMKLAEHEQVAFSRMIELINLCGKHHYQDRPSSQELLDEWSEVVATLNQTAPALTLPNMSPTVAVSETEENDFNPFLQAQALRFSGSPIATEKHSLDDDTLPSSSKKIRQNSPNNK